MRILVIAGIVVALIVGVVVWRRPMAPAPTVAPTSQDLPGQARPASGIADRPQIGPSPAAPPSPVAQASDAPAVAPGHVAAMPPARPAPPASLAGFWSWSADRQETAVTLIQGDPNWSMEVRAFMLTALQVRDLSLVTRNNMAAGLLRQTPALPEFEALLLRMCDDQTEDPEWRNYTLQFLAEVLPTATDRARVEQALRSSAAAETDPRAATAIVHLARLGAAGTVVLDDAFDAQVLALVQNGRQPDFARATALAVAGERQIAGALACARTLAEPGHASDLRRAAIGVLGRSAEPEDQARLHQYAQDADPAVRRVAAANIPTR